MQPCSPIVRACPVDFDDSTFADLIDKKGAKFAAPTAPMEPERPMGEPEGEPGCSDTPKGGHSDLTAVVKHNPTPLLDVDGKPRSVFSTNCWGSCIRKAGMCMMILSAVGLNLTVIAALSESWKPASSSPNGRFRVPVKFPVESGTPIMKVSSKLTPMNPMPAKASKAESKTGTRLTSIKSNKAQSIKAEKAPAPPSQLPQQVAFVMQEVKQDTKKATSVDFTAPASSDSLSAGFGLGDAPSAFLPRSLLKSSGSEQNDDQENGAERHGEFLIKMMAPEDEPDVDSTNDDENSEASKEHSETAARKKLEDMLHEAEEDHRNEIHKGSLLKPEITPEPTAHPSMNSHARLQTYEADENEGGVIARWGSALKTKHGDSEQQGNSPDATSVRPLSEKDESNAPTLWETVVLR